MDLRKATACCQIPRYRQRGTMATRACHLVEHGPILPAEELPEILSERTETRRTRGVLGGRSERVVQQVLVATVGELAASGYGGFRMDVVSAVAGVNKTTIYRRWAGKALLVAAAVTWMRRLVHDVPLPNTGSLERDLVEAFRRKIS